MELEQLGFYNIRMVSTNYFMHLNLLALDKIYSTYILARRKYFTKLVHINPGLQSVLHIEDAEKFGRET